MGGNWALPNGYAHIKRLREGEREEESALFSALLCPYSTTWEQIVVVVEIRKDFALSCSLYMCVCVMCVCVC